MAQRTAVKIGKKLKDFKLKDQNRQEFSLAGCGGKRVLLSFHPLAWTAVCAQQMQSLEKNKKALDRLNAVAVEALASSSTTTSAPTEAIPRINVIRSGGAARLCHRAPSRIESSSG